MAVQAGLAAAPALIALARVAASCTRNTHGRHIKQGLSH